MTSKSHSLVICSGSMGISSKAEEGVVLWGAIVRSFASAVYLPTEGGRIKTLTQMLESIPTLFVHSADIGTNGGSHRQSSFA